MYEKIEKKLKKYENLIGVATEQDKEIIHTKYNDDVILWFKDIVYCHRKMIFEACLIDTFSFEDGSKLFADGHWE